VETSNKPSWLFASSCIVIFIYLDYVCLFFNCIAWILQINKWHTQNRCQTLTTNCWQICAAHYFSTIVLFPPNPRPRVIPRVPRRRIRVFRPGRAYAERRLSPDPSPTAPAGPSRLRRPPHCSCYVIHHGCRNTIRVCITNKAAVACVTQDLGVVSCGR